MRPKPFAILAAGLVLLGLLLLTPRARSTMSSLANRGRASAPGAADADRTAAAGRSVPPAAEEEKPDWPPKAPPPKSPKPKPRSNPLAGLAKGIAAVSPDRDDAFVIRDRFTNTFFTDQGVTLCAVDVSHPGARKAERPGYVVRWGLVGADAVKPRADGERTDKFNRYVGDPSTWTTDQKSYAAVAYDNLQPGVDVQVETRAGGLKYTATLAPGTDPSVLRFRYEGAHGIAVNETGTAVQINTGVAPITEDGLVCWQDGPDGRRKIDARYQAAGPGEVAVVVGEYDPDLPLVVDPVIRWSTYLGGTESPQGDDDAYGVAVDPVGGFIYVTGDTYCVDMPANVGNLQLKGTVDGFLTKLDPGGFFIWSGYIGGLSYDYCNGVAVDSTGSFIYVTGYTASTDFPTTLNAYSRVFGGGYDTFVMRITPAGAVSWSTFLGGNSSDYSQCIAVDGTGVYVAGYTYSTNFPIQSAFKGAISSGPDGFITKLNLAGSLLSYSSYLGGNQSDVVYGIAVDPAGAAYVTGYTYSTDFPNTVPPGGPLKGTVDAFLMKVSPTGGFAWSALIGGTDSDYGYAVCVTNDASPEPVVAGYTYSTNLLTTPGAARPGFQGGTIDGFVTRYKADGSGVTYCTYLGGTSLDFAQAIAPGAAGTVYVSGYTYSNTGFFTSAGAFRTSFVGGPDGFITQVAADGTSFPASTYLGGSSTDYIRSITTVLSGANIGVYTTGQTYSSDFPVPQSPTAIFKADPSLGGTTDAFITKLNLALTTCAWSTYFGGNKGLGDETAFGVAFDPTTPDTVYVGGQTTSLNFPALQNIPGPPPPPAVDTVLGGSQDAFITKISLSGGVASIVWSTYVGGSSTEYGYGLVVDRSGFPYLVGTTYSSDFPTTVTPSHGGVETFVFELTPSGGLYYSTLIGGNSSDYGYAIAVDFDYNAYVTGYTYSSNFPTVVGVAKPVAGVLPEVFVQKLNISGSYVWGTFLGGSDQDYGYGIAVAPTNAPGATRVYVTGQTWSTDFVVPPVGPDSTLNVAPDAFATALSATNGSMVWNRYLGGTNSDYGQCVATDPTGAAVYFSGFTYSTDFPTTAGAYKQTTTYEDIYVTRLDPANGNHNTGSAWSTFLGGFSYETVFGLAVDTSQNVYITGYTYSSDFPNKGAVQPNISGTPDAFVTKMYANGASLAWSTFLGGSQSDLGYAVSVDSASRAVYVAGQTNSPDFPFALGFDNSLGGQYDAFVVRLDNANPDLPNFAVGGTGQFKMDGTTSLAVGAWTKEDNIVVKAKLTDSDDDQVQLEVEIRLIAVAFDGTVTATSAPVASGSIASVTVPLAAPPGTRYHWTARTKDSTGRTSAWFAFGGNSDALPAARDIGKDQTAPSVTISAPATNPFYTTSGSVGMNGTVSDVDAGPASVSYFNAANNATGGATLVLNNWNVPGITLVASTAVSAIPNNITISSTDAAGNTGTANITVYQDVTQPNGTVGGADFDTSSNSAGISGTANDNVQIASVTWSNSLGGSGVASYNAGTGNWTATVSPLSPGSNVITITITDSAGNQRTVTRTIFYDNLPPSLSVTSPAPGFITNAATLNVSGTASDNRALATPNAITWKNTTNNATGATSVSFGNWSVTGIPLVVNTVNSIQITATDKVGLTTVSNFTVTQDQVKPSLSLTFPAVSPFSTGSDKISFSGTASDGIGLGSIAWSRTAPTPASGSGVLNSPGATASTWTCADVDLAVGTNDFTITVTDLAGNTQFLTTQVIYDITSPVVRVFNPATNPTVIKVNSIAINGNADDLASPGGTIASVVITNTTTGATPAPTLSGIGTDTATWSVTVNNLAIGPNIIQIDVADGTNLHTIVNLTVIYDPQAPTVKITGPTTADSYFTGFNQLIMTGTATDNRAVTSVTWSTSAGPQTGVCLLGLGTWTVNPASQIPLVLGTQTITITASDEATNSATTTLDVTYDPAKPTITISSPTVADTTVVTTSTIDIGGSATDNVGVLLVTWVNAATGDSGVASGTTSWTVTGIPLAAAPTANPITVIATDVAGNLRSDTIVVFYDTAAPTVSITGPVPSGGTFTTSAANVSLTGIAGDDVGLQSVQWTNTTNATTGLATGLASWTTAAITLIPGNNIIQVKATDLTLKTQTTSITVHHDPNLPSIVITDPTPNPTYSTTDTPIDLAGTASDLVGGGGVPIDAASVTWDNLTTGGSGTASQTPGSWAASVPLTPGMNSIQVTAYDSAGNSASASIVVTYDPAAPFVSIITPTTGLTFATGTAPAALAGISSDDVGVVSVTWSTDAAVLPTSGPTTGTTANWTASPPLAPGVNTITVTATDGVGRTGTARITITYDPTPPSVAITQPTSENTFKSTISPLTIGGAASDNLQIQSVTWVNTTTGATGIATGIGAWTIPGVDLVEGDNVITVTATDGVGNTDQATITVNYDGTPPSIAIDPLVGGPPFSTRPMTITGTADDNLGVVSVTYTNSLGGGGSAAYDPVLKSWSASVYLYPGAVGNVLTFTATDAHGYSTSDQVTVVFTPETSAPSIQITGPSGTGSAISPTQIVTLSGTADDLPGVVAVTWKNQATGVKGAAVMTAIPLTTAVNWTTDVPLVSGVNVIVVTAIDDAGNKTSATIDVTYTAPSDAIAPQISVSGPTLAGVYDTSVSPVLVTLEAVDTGGSGVAFITWGNEKTHGGGVCDYLSGTTWTVNIGLTFVVTGVNKLTFTAHDAAGNTAETVLVVNFTPPPGDIANPVVTIQSHSTIGLNTVFTPTVNLSGIASDNIQVAEIVWFDAATNASGDADGTTAWTGTITLVPGDNVITLTAYDTSGNFSTSQATIKYVYVPPPVHIQAGACGLTGLEALLALALAAGLRRRARKGAGR
jgi:hypothetical protein